MTSSRSAGNAGGSGSTEASIPHGVQTTYYANDHAYHIQTRLPDGRPAFIVDPGSVGNLCGDKWAKQVAIAAARAGHHPSYERRPRPLQVSGVGHGSQTCKYDCRLPVALRHAGEQRTSIGEFTVPSVQDSEMPGLLGRTSLTNNRAVWDFITEKLYFLGPGDYDLIRALPPGTDVFQLERAPSGHSVLPCCEYSPETPATEHTLTLLSRRQEEAPPQQNLLPPPPVCPPVLPITAQRAERLAPPPATAPGNTS